MTSSSTSPSPDRTEEEEYIPPASGQTRGSGAGRKSQTATRPKAGGVSGARKGKGGRGRGATRAAKVAAERAEQEKRLVECHRERMAATQRILQQLSEPDLRSLACDLMERQPGLVFDALAIHQNRQGPPPSAGLPGVPWCSCGNCRDMPSDREKKCCGQQPANCISLLPHFSQYCLDEGYLRIHRQYREDVTVLGRAREPGADNREYRYAAYRHYIYWQHGSLGSGHRLVIPSCCVVRIRDKFPDPHQQYTGFKPGI